MMKTTLHTLILVALTAGLAACTTTTPNLDRNFGQAVTQARAQQTINPDASLNTDPVAGLDGVAANAAIDNYTKSVMTPPPPATVINIGGGLSGN
jgi:tetrahydromethanopterin S-methyltransferase subunit E